MATLHVRLEPRHCEDRSFNDCKNCPGIVAAREALGTHAEFLGTFGCDYTYFNRKAERPDPCIFSSRLPAELEAIVIEMQCEGRTDPFEFDLELPPWTEFEDFKQSLPTSPIPPELTLKPRPRGTHNRK